MLSPLRLLKRAESPFSLMKKPVQTGWTRLCASRRRSYLSCELADGPQSRCRSIEGCRVLFDEFAVDIDQFGRELSTNDLEALDI